METNIKAHIDKVRGYIIYVQKFKSGSFSIVFS